MKSRTSCCKNSLLVQDLKRFGPVAALYTIVLMLFTVLMIMSEPYFLYRVSGMVGMTLFYIIFAFFYAMVVAQCLFGDLYNTRLCYGLHSLPIKRDCQFMAHVVTGLLFAFVPTVLAGLCTIPLIGEYGYLSGLLILAGCLSYLFFFAVAVLCIMLSGSRFGMILCYGLVNFPAVLVMWFATSVYGQLLHGVKIPEKIFMNLTPVFALVDHTYINVDSDWSGPAPLITSLKVVPQDYYFLAILAAVGLVILAVSQVLYRLRKLECAGDLLAFPKLRPVVQVMITLACGAFLQLFGQIIAAESAGFVLLVIGMVIGHIGGLMRFERQTNVFRKQNFYPLAVMLGVLAVSIGIVAMDPMGIASRIPDDAEIASVAIAPGTMDDRYGSGMDFTCDEIEMDQPEQIAMLKMLHKAGIEGKVSSTQSNFVAQFFGVYNYYRNDVDENASLILCYHLKNGKDLYRYYNYSMIGDNEVTQAIRSLLSRPEVLLDIQEDTYEEALKSIERIDFDNWALEKYHTFTAMDQEDIRGLMDAYIADCKAGTTFELRSYRATAVEGSVVHDYDNEIGNLHIKYYPGVINSLRAEDYGDIPATIYLYIYRENVNTISWLEAHGFQIAYPEDVPEDAVRG